MKTDIITFHFVNNFGGALQAYALQKAIGKYCNSDVEIIDYRNSFIMFTDTVRLFPISHNVHEIVSGLNTIGDRFGRKRKFKKFQYNKMNLTSKHYHHYSLKACPPEADVFVCGSDQIWNPYLTLGLKGAYFLDFVPRGKVKIAYSPSFGKSNLNSYFMKKIQLYIKDFNGISVREKTGIRILNEITTNEIVQLIDPTFLLKKKEWEEIATDIEIKEPYMLLYIMQSDNTMYKYAKKLKDKLGLRIVEISRYGYNPGFVDETLVDVGPSEFLGLFKNADYVCTNSYHGFIFSLIFEKRFSLVPCKRFRTRIYNLADILSIKVNDKDVDETIYDPEKVNSCIVKERDKSIDWLLKQYKKY